MEPAVQAELRVGVLLSRNRDLDPIPLGGIDELPDEALPNLLRLARRKPVALRHLVLRGGFLLVTPDRPVPEVTEPAHPALGGVLREACLPLPLPAESG